MDYDLRELYVLILKYSFMVCSQHEYYNKSYLISLAQLDVNGDERSIVLKHKKW